MNADKRGFKTRIGKLSALIGIGPRVKAPSSLTPDLRARIQQSFDESSGDEEHFPATIDPRIYHVKLIREHLGDEVFATAVPRNVRLGEAPSHGLPISRYDPTCAGSDAYFDLAMEIVTRAPADGRPAPIA